MKLPMKYMMYALCTIPFIDFKIGESVDNKKAIPSETGMAFLGKNDY